LIVDDNSFNIMALRMQIEILMNDNVVISEAILPSKGIELILWKENQSLDR
jgi:hypothetical protein